jgi:hypothetical protein
MPLSDGLAGTEETVAVMQRLALQGAALPRVREQAERIIRGLPARDWGAEARCLAAWVKRHMRYTRDGLTIETIKTVPRMLDDIEKYGAALLDCDDAAVLLGSLLLTIGHAPAYQLLGRGEIPHHVNVLDRTSGMELDPTGEPRGVFRFRRVYPLPMEG